MVTALARDTQETLHCQNTFPTHDVQLMFAQASETLVIRGNRTSLTAKNFKSYVERL